MARARHLLFAPPHDADCRVNGVDVSVLMAALTAERSIATFRVRSRREVPIRLRLEAMAWRWEGGLNVLSPTDDLTPTPASFDIPPGGEQVVRLAVHAFDPQIERAYRVFIHEDTGVQYFGLMAAMTSEMAPVFVTPVDARCGLSADVEQRGYGAVLALANKGRARAHILAVKDLRVGRMPAPRYLLAGARAEIVLPSGSNLVTIEAADIEGTRFKRVVPITPAPQLDFGLST